MNISHESLHQPTTDPLWRESYYFNLPGSDLALETTIGLRPSQGVVERMALVFYRDETLISIELGRLAEFTPSALQAETVSYKCSAPLDQWQIRIAGEFLVLPQEEEKEIMSFLLEVRNGRLAKRTPVALDLAFQGVMLPDLNRDLKEIYWQLREEPDDPLPLIWSLFEPESYERFSDTRPNVASALIIAGLDSLLRQRAPQLLSLFAGQATATSLIGQRMWELRQTAEKCGPEVRQMLEEGIVALDAYRALPAAAPFVTDVEGFLYKYGHRGFRHEGDWATERLADHPEHILLAVAAQLSEGQPPEVRAEAARQPALEALRRMNPAERFLWWRILRWGQQLIAWRERSKSHVALHQATYGLAARHLARHFYPGAPDDSMVFYTIDEFLAFARSRGERRVAQTALDGRRAQFELQKAQPPPPELIWYDPLTQHWRPTLEEEKEKPGLKVTRRWGIAASAGSGPTEGIAVVTNDPLDAGRRLLELKESVILVTRLTDPAWSGLFPRLSAVITELGGVISHAAIIARENGLPAVVGVPEVTRWVRDGQRVRVDGASGIVEVLE